jgi:hypothetical protein
MTTGLKRRAKAAQTNETTPAEPAAPEAPAPDNTPAPAARTLTGRKIDPTLLRAAAAAAKQARGQKTPFLKLTAGDNRIRLLGPRDPEQSILPYFEHRIHKFKPAGARYDKEVIDLDWLFRNEPLANAAMAAGKLRAADFEMWSRYGGDPFNIAAARAKDLGLTGKNSDAPYLWGRDAIAFNVIDRADSSVRIWIVTRKRFEELWALYEGSKDEDGNVDPDSVFDIFDEDSGHDLLVKGNGQAGFQRRYTITVAKKPTPAGSFDVADMVNLPEFAVRRVIGWEQKVVSLFQSYGDFMRVLGFKPSNFGVNAEINVNTAPAAGEDDNEGDEE